MSEMIFYYMNSAGHWIARRHFPQCSGRVFPDQVCQGVAGHAGRHWAFSPSGWLTYTEQSADGIEGDSGAIPPGHARYLDPVVMAPEVHSRHFTEIEVTDPALIERLNASRLRHGESSLCHLQGDKGDDGFDLE